ncbi:sulfatase-like hydrolase/transferase [Vibrio cortegadensis]|uniref:sulfatase-like hydrolase/transferase n=1 Tax=Vibrio cortegadensis TaxID=1328770 RepID=UPI0021C3C941|nr:sulfatase-like hydrolase/transferase [Vibrio cortegadensis]MDN3697263.1 sulfatase-like hydrolase/transferase [Vibrio cortegadensis]
MKKNTLVCLIGAALSSTAFAGTSASALPEAMGANRAPSNQPNVIVVLLDDAGYADISANGGTFPTPNIDKLAADGQNFSSFYMSAPVSSPARASLLTGRVGVRTGMYGKQMAVFEETDKDGLPKTEVTMAEMLRDEGYKTFMLGKWHLGWGKDGIEHVPTRHGFQEWYGIPFSTDMNNTNPEFRLKPIKKSITSPAVFKDPAFMAKWIERDNQLASFKDGRSKNEYFQVPLYHSFSSENGTKFEDNLIGTVNQTTFLRDITSRTVEYINNNKDEPFFIYFNPPESHVPLFNSPEFIGKTETPYGDVMVEQDYSIGRIMRALKLNSIDDNTIVVFTSDNGPWLGYADRGAAGSAKPFKDGKSSPYEGGARVPGIITWSGQIPAGANDSMFSALDLMPTIASMTGAKLPNVEIDGIDQSGLLLRGEDAPRDFVPVFMRGQLVGFRKGDYKLTYTGVSLISDGVKKKPKMYNLAKDIGEKRNIAKKEKAKYADMIKMADEYVTSLGKPAEPLFDFDD